MLDMWHRKKSPKYPTPPCMWWYRMNPAKQITSFWVTNGSLGWAVKRGNMKIHQKSHLKHKYYGVFTVPITMTKWYSPWKLVTIVSELVYFTYLRDLQPTYTGVMIHLLSSMDIPVMYHVQYLVLFNIIFRIWRSNKNTKTSLAIDNGIL